MVEVDLSSSDYARILYHFDNSVTEKTDYTKWKERYETLVKNMKLSGLKVEKEYVEKHEKDMDEKDEKLRWKLQIIQEAKHQEEINEEEEDDDD